MRHDLKRLQNLAERGDTEAAEALWLAAQRANDIELAVLAATTLDDIEKLIVLAGDAWSRGDQALRSRCARALGFDLDDATASGIDALLDSVQRRRSLRCIGRVEILRALGLAVRHPRGFNFQHGGRIEEPGSLSNARTTLCLAVRCDDHLVLGIAQARAVSGTPGGAWPELRPWREDVSTLKARLASWAAAATAGQAPTAANVPGERSVTAVKDRFVLPRTTPVRADRAVSAPLQTPQDAAEVFASELLRRLELEPGNIDAWNTACRAVDAGSVPFRAVSAALDAHWPDAGRVAKSRWLDAISSAKLRPRPHWALVRHLDLGSLLRVIEPERLERLRTAPWLQLITTLTLPWTRDDKNNSDLEALLRTTGLSDVQTLDATRCALDDRLFDAVLRNPNLGRMRTLKLGAIEPAREGAQAGPLSSSLETLTVTADFAALKRGILSTLVELFGNANLPALRSLELRGPDITNWSEDFDEQTFDALIEAIYANPSLRKIERLLLVELYCSPRGIKALAERDALLPELRWLAIPHIEKPLAAALAAWSQLATLDTLEIGYTTDTTCEDAALAQLLGSPHLARLRRLSLTQVDLKRRALEAIARLPALRELELNDVRPTSPNLVRFLSARNLPPLERLSLTNCSLSREVVAALVAAPALQSVQQIDLTGSKLARSSVAALTASPLRRAVVGVAGASGTNAWHNV